MASLIDNFDNILDELRAGESLNRTLKKYAISHGQFNRYTKHLKERTDAYHEAREDGTHAWAYKIIDTIESCPAQMEEIARAKLKCDNYARLMAKLCPQVYGDSERRMIANTGPNQTDYLDVMKQAHMRLVSRREEQQVIDITPSNA